MLNLAVLQGTLGAQRVRRSLPQAISALVGSLGYAIHDLFVGSVAQRLCGF